MRTMHWYTKPVAMRQSWNDRGGYSLHYINLLSIYFPELVDTP
ncbi:hypothetical protein BN8_04067 [Fibrisoma limi BUZ 3]|uniref:Uncharacterized protein n=1 Tax=Fibrisoma limi BUZ 3 TaxID=1185876 RepID=I2GLS8_9BACT|nr:hypothetical protein BN8_04067 [Fibrisoma limi BUZ 3]